MQRNRVKKAVFPVAGLGTRFLPATKASPKEMLPVVDKPLIQYAAEEVVGAGVDVLVFINGRNKDAIPNHFDKAFELEAILEAKGNKKLLHLVRNLLPPSAACVYLRQAEALGLGHAVLCAAPVVGEEPFAVLLADDLIDGGEASVLEQMLRAYDQHGGTIVAVEEVNGREIERYGVVAVQQVSERVSRVERIVEKPKMEEAPSNLGVVGRYILSPTIFRKLAAIQPGSGGELQLTDAIAALIGEEDVWAYRFEGHRYDCGSKLGYLQATVAYGLKHAELGSDFSAYLRTLDSSELQQP